MKLPTIHQMPFLRMLLPMIVGILFYQLYPHSWPTYLFGAISLLFLLFPVIPLHTVQSFRFREIFGIGVSLAFLTLGFYLSERRAQAVSYDFVKGKTFGVAEIISQPEEKEHSIACYMKVSDRKDSSGNFQTTDKQLSVYFHKDLQTMKLRQGDKVRFCAEIKPLVNTNRPGGFDYAAYLNRQGICGTAYIDSAYWKKIPGERSFNLYYLANELRNDIIETFRTFHFRENEFALLTATTIGYTDELSQEQKGNFSAVGLSHLMAVSGMQTAMIFAMVMFLLGFIPKNTKWFKIKFVITLVILWVFTFVTGLSPSVVRASLMLSVFLLGGLFERPVSPFNSLAFSGFIILLLNPMTLFDIGFQLSYAAVISILIAQAFLSDSINQKKIVPRY
ncbi:MAG: ComEC/Rec2 family competence protein, partial [Bacteroidota bacterium]|nr:ComEC/Rec2 family competence protein [Bacteroidota bacterium]